MSHNQLRTLFVIVLASHQIFAGEIIERLDIITKIEGESITLHCPNKLGIPKESLAWSKLDNNEWANINGASHKIMSNGDLVIEKLKYEDAGEYLCQYGSDFGDRQYSMSLIVKRRTRAVLKHDDAIAGKSLVIHCEMYVDSTLSYDIEWKLNEESINFESDKRFIKQSDNTIIIEKANCSDSGNYSCVVTTNFERENNAIDSTELVVKDVPNQPSINVTCNPLEAIIEFKSNGDNGADIKRYTIEYSTSADPDNWKNLAQVNKLQKFRSHMVLRWTNYTFRVIAHNRIGSSTPSEPTLICTSESDMPYQNPRGVIGRGTSPTNMVVSWIPMPPCLQNGPGFHYRVCWRRSSYNEWNCKNVTDWTQNNYTIYGLETFEAYEIQVKSVNDIDESYREDIYIGYSGEDEPTLAPENFKLVNITDFENAILRWDPVPLESVRGNITRYVIQFWNEIDGHENKREKFVGYKTFLTTIANLRRSTVYYAQIYVKNRKYSGPKSEILEFMTPSPDPSSVQCIEAYPLGSSALLLKWTKPTRMNGKLTGYNIFYGNVNGKTKHERLPRITNPETTNAKLSGLEPNTTYRLYIIPITIAIDGVEYFIKAKTNEILDVPIKPHQPTFDWKILSSEEKNMTVKVTWIPDLAGYSGSHFFVKYRLKGEREWTETRPVYAEDYAIINGLLNTEIYEFEVISVDGDQTTESKSQEVCLDLSSSPFAKKNLIIIIMAVTLSIMTVFCTIRLILRFCNKKRSIRKRKLNEYISSKNYTENVYHINANRYTFHRTKDGIQERLGQNDDFMITEEKIKNKSTTKQESNYDFKHFVSGIFDIINSDMTLDEQVDMLPYDPKYEFPREKLEIGKRLGTGAFGVVLEATAYGIVPDEDRTTVAVKTVRKAADNEVFRTLALELKIMIHLGKHLNIVNLLGAVTKNIAERELLIIVEYCEFGNLHSFLVKNRQHFVDQIIAEEDQIDPNITCRKAEATNGYLLYTPQAPAASARSITTTDLLCWSFQIARGMQYLATRKVLHGDLAARNILLCDNNVVKICDFGLARSMHKTGNYLIKTERPLPYKWLALESIGDHVFSTYSDVWSYGIVLWELFSLGAVPYPGMIAGAALFKMLKEGYRMECPDFATQEIYDIMLSCWDETPESRPLFHQLVNKFSKMLEQNVTEHYILLNEPYSKENEARSNFVEIDYLGLITSPEIQFPSARSTLNADDSPYYLINKTQTTSNFQALEN